MIDNFVIEGTLSSNATNELEDFLIYPNPTGGKLTISLPTSEKVSVDLFDLRGRKVYQSNFESEGTMFTKDLDLTSIQSGVYIINVKTEGKEISKRVIIE